MIPKFKEYLNESVWADVRKKSLGLEDRMENDVNHMSFDDFTAYITDIYSKEGNWFSISDSVSGKDLHIDLDIINGITLKYNVSEGKLYNILIDVHDKNLKPLNVSKLENDFQIEQLHQSQTYEVRNLDGTISNNTYVKLIEFFMANKDTLLMESVWGDIRKKSLGKEDRIQDDVNNLDINGLCEYIKDNYEFITHEAWPVYAGTKMNTDIPYLHVLLFYDSERTLPNVPAYIYFNPVDIQFMPANMPGRNVIKYFHDDKLLDALKSSFDLVEDEKDGRNYHINPKDGENANNKFILKVLDTFAENAHRPIIQKKC